METQRVTKNTLRYHRYDMVQDPELTKAVASIPQRSEKQSDIQKIVGAFVDVGILPQIQNINSQIVYGRRGTGKTHVMRVLASNLGARPNTAVIYTDARTLGSTNQFSDSTVPLPARCTALFRDILNEIYNGLLEYIVNVAPTGTDSILVELDVIATAGTESQMTPTSYTDKKTDQSGAKAALSFDINAKGPSLSGNMENDHSSTVQTTTNYVAQSNDKIVFPAIGTALKKILSLCSSQLYILIDEWSSIPLDVQPYLAEFIKRSLLPLTNVTVKIASLEYRSNFGISTPNALIGFEMGADISAFLDIDDYYVFDRNPDAITDSFGDMLVKHLGNELPDGYLARLGIVDGITLASKLFTERKVFQELVRASEGVARDLINIFSKAYLLRTKRGETESNGAQYWKRLDSGLSKIRREISTGSYALF
jgi:hypothetical protein